LGAVVGGVVADGAAVVGVTAVVGAFRVTTFPLLPLDLHAVAPRPIIATQTMGAMRRRTVLPVAGPIRVKYLVLLDHL
jgi:hypothetical protein